MMNGLGNLTDEEIIEQLGNYIAEALEGFNMDPADNDYQEGYAAACADIGTFLLSLLNYTDDIGVEDLVTLGDD